jgi:predicted O-methyltransferase YrrM
MNTRNELAQRFKGIGIELGVAAGDYSAEILNNPNVDTLYSIDRWSDHHNLEEYLDVLYTLGGHAGRSYVLRATFDEALPLFEDESLDFVYIDGYAHTGQDGGKTLEDWWPKVKDGGIFAGHDYHKRWPETMKRVDQFVERHNLRWSLTRGDQYPSWIIQR